MTEANTIFFNHLGQTVTDIGRTPLAASQGAQAAFTALSSLFDTTLNAGIAATGLQVIHVDTFALLAMLILRPQGLFAERMGKRV